ncbi:proline-rich protein 18 [Hypomesus transpacificus]|uniref:proline-rich protein 18 n=1 Tax=Hypomesus transpacificus TaxID=137520 RepID=UPI001F073B3C|nr:proline-rich protein 18 [Hypomesus transpacificus]
MPFPPIKLHSRISSPGRDLFRRKKDNLVPSHSIFSNKSGEEIESAKEKMSMSWSSANLRNLGRKPQQPKTKLPAQKPASVPHTEVKSSWLSLPKPRDSCNSVTRSSSMESTTHRGSKQSSRSSLGKDEGEGEIQFSLSLTPEAILVIQKRNLEKQMMAKQQKCCASADFRHRRVFPSKKAQGGSKSSAPVVKLEGSEDITTIVKISLLNDQYKYDDVEYEEEDGDVDETVLRKCREWLKGVESAAAFGKVDKLASLPHLKGC